MLGFPANDFGAQEPGTDAEIATFCATNYDVEFPMFSKIDGDGRRQAPALRRADRSPARAAGRRRRMRERLKRLRHRRRPRPGEVLWNFEKFLIGRDGKVVGRFAPGHRRPTIRALVEAIDAALAA